MSASTKMTQKSSQARQAKRNLPKRDRVRPRKGKGGRPRGAISFREQLERQTKAKETKKMKRHLKRNYKKLCGLSLDLFTREEVDKLARECGFYLREPREIRAFDFVLCCALGSVVEGKRSFASIWRLMIFAAGVDVARSAVTQRFGSGSAQLMEKLVGLVSQRLSKSVCPRILERLQRFHKVLAHDGSVISLSSLLKKLFPARRTTSMDSALRVHGTADVIQWQIVRVVVTGDREDELRVARTMPIEKDVLYINDLGYFCYSYFKEVENNGAHIVSRVKSNANPTIVNIRHGLRAPVKIAREGWGLNDARLPDYFLKKADTFDLDAMFKTDEGSVKLRVIGVYDADIDSYHMFVTTLKAQDFSPKEIGQIYRLRWTIELLFKLLKSSCHMDHVDTSNPDAIRTHIYSSVLAGMLLYETFHAVCKMTGIHPVELSPLTAGTAYPLMAIPLLIFWLGKDLSLETLLERIVALLVIGCRDQNPKRTQKHRDISQNW